MPSSGRRAGKVRIAGPAGRQPVVGITPSRSEFQKSLSRRQSPAGRRLRSSPSGGYTNRRLKLPLAFEGREADMEIHQRQRPLRDRRRGHRQRAIRAPPLLSGRTVRSMCCGSSFERMAAEDRVAIVPDAE